MKLKNLEKKVRRLEARLREGPKKLAKLKRKLAAMAAEKARKAQKKAAARAVARQTGESLSTIRRHGFSIIELPDLEPQMVDWDTVQAERVTLFPGQQQGRRAA